MRIVQSRFIVLMACEFLKHRRGNVQRGQFCYIGMAARVRHQRFAETESLTFCVPSVIKVCFVNITQLSSLGRFKQIFHNGDDAIRDDDLPTFAATSEHL